jgi:unsaturated chondroitin disaccharide hydrolase
VSSTEFVEKSGGDTREDVAQGLNRFSGAPNPLCAEVDRMVGRVYATALQVGEEFPYYADDSGKWTTTADGDWCGGHWVGMLWIAYRRTGDVLFRDLALRLTHRMAERVHARDMFRGVIHYYSAAMGADLLGKEGLAEIAVRAAEGVCSMYNRRARMIPVGHQAQVKGATVRGEDIGAVDNAMVPLMVVWWAWQRTKRPEFAEVATAVTEQVCHWFIRPDGSTWQAAIFDPQTGELLRRQTVLGYSVDTCWSRGQSWLLYGLANAYLHVRRTDFLENWRRVWDFYQRQVPEDLVPYYDFSDPRVPNVPRDTSAASLAAAALGLIAEACVDDPTEYFEASKSVALSLIDHYWTDDGRLQQGCFNLPGRVATKNELIWGSYYLMETLDRLVK